MIFSTVTFLFYFLPLFLLIYFVLPFRNTALLIASLIFYAWGEPENFGLLVISILLNYGFGLAIGKAKSQGRTGKPELILGIIVNLGGLTYFKYFNFLMAGIKSIFVTANVALPEFEVVALPLGISFLTFHAISYLVDVYREKTKCEKNVFALSTYMTMFPQLVAGPIIRFSTVARQLHHRHHTWNRIDIGIQIFIVGLAQKVLIANMVALPADKIFSLAATDLSFVVAWLGIVCYSLQIYFDFFGYSNMAIGLGLMLGFTFPRNFNLPYVARSLTEFWQRWHLSLSRWFRDYLYIPLGGNRVAPWRTYLNLFIVFFLCGLWHGASWTFVFWGVFHGFFLIVERAGLGELLKKAPNFLRHCYTLIVVMIAWVFFRADSFSQAADFLYAMFGLNHFQIAAAPVGSFLNGVTSASLIIGILLALPPKNIAANVFRAYRRSVWVRMHFLFGTVRRACLLGIFVLSAISLASGAYNPFIYFRF